MAQLVKQLEGDFFGIFLDIELLLLSGTEEWADMPDDVIISRGVGRSMEECANVIRMEQE